MKFKPHTPIYSRPQWSVRICVRFDSHIIIICGFGSTAGCVSTDVRKGYSTLPKDMAELHRSMANFFSSSLV